MKKLPSITNKQQEILTLLYKHRFLNRIQVQALLHHKDKVRTSVWLKDLRQKGYVQWIYDASDFTEKSKPAIYYLGLNGIRFLRRFGDYSEDELRKRYREATRRSDFISRCLLLADCCINMDAVTADAGDNRTYTYTTESDYLDPDSEWNFLIESEYIHPQLYYHKEQDTDNELVVTHNLLEMIDPSLPRHSLRKKIKGYIQFLDSEEWVEGTKEMDDVDELPVIMIACPTKAGLIYAKRCTRAELEATYGDGNDDIPEDIQFRFTTVEQIRKHRLTGRIWEEL